MSTIGVGGERNRPKTKKIEKKRSEDCKKRIKRDVRTKYRHREKEKGRIATCWARK